MEGKCSSETLVDFQRATRRYIPEDSTLNNKLNRIWKEATVNEFKVLCWQLSGRTEENHEKP
jgi:hypothetical protein